jgi:pseudaminic acid synthase
MVIEGQNFKIGKGVRPFIIAEMSGNHNQSLKRALEIVDEAAKAGVSAIKLQTYTADTITMKGVYRIKDNDSLWAGKELYDLYSEAYTPWEWHAEIFDYARKKGLLAFSSPFDETAVDFLESLNVELYKIASFENNHYPLLKKVARTGKPVIMSTGTASLINIKDSVQVLKDNGCSQIILLKCTSTYPASPTNSNIITIPALQNEFPDCLIGLSDHTMGIGVSIASIALGTTIIEKHFTINRSDGGVDSAFSMEPAEMKSLVIESERAWQSMGEVQFNIQEAEVKNLIFKRSVYVVNDIKEGEEFSSYNLKVIRPGDGLHPRFYDEIIGRKANTNIPKGTPMSLNFVVKE